MRTYEAARALVGASEIAGYAGGWTRYVKYQNDPHSNVSNAIVATIFGNPIVTWHPDGRISLDTCGYFTSRGRVSPSTIDGMATALGLGRNVLGTVKYVPHLAGRPFTLERSGLYNDRYIFTLTPCDECGASVPDTESMVSHFHETSCSLYPSTVTS